MCLALTCQSFGRVARDPLPEGACDSQPLAQESMDPVVSMVHHVRIYSETNPIRGPPCQHPPCKASVPAVPRGAPPPSNRRCESSTLRCIPVSPIYMARGPWLRQWRALDASRALRDNYGSNGKICGGARLVLGTRTLSIPIHIPPLL